MNGERALQEITVGDKVDGSLPVFARFLPSPKKREKKGRNF